MKRRQFTAIMAALVLAVSSTVLLTGCAGKAYYYDKLDDGTFSRVGLVPDNNAAASSTPSTQEESTEDASTAEVSEQTAEESSEEEKSEEEKSEQAGNNDVLAVIKIEMPADWEASNVIIRVSDSEYRKNGDSGAEMTVDSDGLYTYEVPKFASNNEEFVEPKFNITFTNGDSSTIRSTEDTLIEGSKTYVASQDGKKYILTAK